MAKDEDEEKSRRSSRPVVWIIGLTFAVCILLVGGMAVYALVLVPRMTQQALDAELPLVSYRELIHASRDQQAVMRFAGNERILIVDFPDLGSQGRMLNRIAALIEKRNAPRDRVLNDAELESFIISSGSSPETFFYGHDYKAADLAKFFSLAESDGIELNESERDLRDLLLVQNFFRPQSGGYQMQEPEQALVTVVQQQADDPETRADETVDSYLRDTILRHELSHGDFFTNKAYRDYCRRFWQRELTQKERMIFRDFLISADYDPGNEYIMINEMQAFMMHTLDARAFSAAHLNVSESYLADLRRRFVAGEPPSVLFDEDHPIYWPIKSAL